MTDRNAPQLPRHGGDLAFATARYGAPADGWLDLSTGVNPHPYPVVQIDPRALAHLPDPAALATLIATARSAYGVPEGASLIASTGTEIAIRLLPLLAPPGPVAIVSPTYGSHAEAWRNAGRTVAPIAAISAVTAATAIVVVANPNNPDGGITDPRELADLASLLSRRGGLLVLDEAFSDVAPAASLTPHLRTAPAVVLRSFGKFYGLPGLRLGFVAGPATITARLAALLGDWPISAPALAIGIAALADTAWPTATRARLADDALRLRSLLATSGLAVRGGTDLFVLVDDPGAGDLHQHLARQGIWTRIFADQRTWLRMGLPPDDAGFARLQRALATG